MDFSYAGQASVNHQVDSLLSFSRGPLIMRLCRRISYSSHRHVHPAKSPGIPQPTFIAWGVKLKRPALGACLQASNRAVIGIRLAEDPFPPANPAGNETVGRE
ncbi:hypothetical protein [Stieleria mannarensis]|uniref:hypothetical protein n=1 Tax=Stieleria mannarensis TaxID=2755585 RepID=UPI001600A255|nr:hypothetical protein [Rhodopirellula sp. JC639]